MFSHNYSNASICYRNGKFHFPFLCLFWPIYPLWELEEEVLRHIPELSWPGTSGLWLADIPLLNITQQIINGGLRNHENSLAITIYISKDEWKWI